MIFAIAIVNVLLSALLFFIKARQNSPFMMFYLTLCVMFLLPAVLDRPGEVIDFHQFASPVHLTFDGLSIAHLFIFLVLFGFLVLESRWPLKRKIQLSKTVSYYSCLLPPAFVLASGLVGYVFYGSGLLYASFTSVRAGEFGLVSLVLAYFSILSIPSAALALSKDRYVSCLFALIPLIIPIAIFGSARQPLVISVFAISFVMLQKLKVKNGYMMVVMVLLVPVAELILEILKQVRNLPDFGSRVQFFIGGLGQLDLSGQYGESRLRFVYYIIVNGVEIEKSGEFTYLLRALFFWLPSAIDVFSIKPDDFEYSIFSAVMGGRSGTMHPTFFGILMADAGWFFIPWVVMTFIVMRFIENALLSRKVGLNYLYFFCFYVAVMWARGSIYAPLVLLFIVMVIYYSSNIITRVRLSKQQRQDHETNPPEPIHRPVRTGRGPGPAGAQGAGAD